MIVLNSLLYKPLKKYFTERQAKIQNDVNEASQSIEKAKQLVSEKENELKKALDEARSIKDSIQKAAELHAEEIYKSAKNTEHNMITLAENKIVDLNKQAMQNIESQISEIVAELVGKVLGEKIDEVKDKELINRMIAQRGQG